MKIIYEKRKIIVLIISIVLIIGIIAIVSVSKKREIEEEITLLDSESIKTTKSIKQFVDVKGSVKNPGVYTFTDNERVIDAINKAGGLKDDANTSNINLSKKLTSEMVIYVFNNKELKDEKLSCDNICKTEIIEVNNCIEVTTKKLDKTDTKININTASLDELMNISGIGESKAKSIIEYRKDNRFNSIEDIKKISGIGESLFNKIKDNITV